MCGILLPCKKCGNSCALVYRGEWAVTNLVCDYGDNQDDDADDKGNHFQMIVILKADSCFCHCSGSTLEGTSLLK